MHRNLAYVSAESSSAMMILTMNIISDRSADGHKTGSWRDREEPTFGKEYIDNVGKTNPSFAANDAARFVEGENTIETLAVNQFTPVVETRIAVTAAETMWQ